ncbi:MAG: DNA repair protein RadC [bacterium]|nr:DNA repair protein RadC [bacterium]
MPNQPHNATNSPSPPHKSKPQLREKLTTEGPEALTLPELLAIIFNTGTQKESVEQLTQRVLKEYGTHALRDARNVDELAAHARLPHHKACMLVACFELGRRLFRPQRPNATPYFIRSPVDVYEYTRDMASLRKEQLRGLYLNARNAIIHDEVISVGTLTANLVSAREVFLPALTYAAVSVIVVHNHPSGNPEPSTEDIAITSRLAQAASVMDIKLLDHIIIGDETHGYCSLGEKGYL